MFHLQDKNLIATHIIKINAVIELMQQELIKKRGGQINFGEYTSPIPAFENNDTWLENRYKPQRFKTVFAILNLGIQNHQRRIAILNRIKDEEYIYTDEHALLMMVKALKKDPYIADYNNIYIAKNFNRFDYG